MALKEQEKILLTFPSGVLTIYYGRGDMQDFQIEQDATRPKLVIKLRDEAGNIPSTTLSSAVISMWNFKSGATKLNAVSMAIDDGTNWVMSYAWATGTDEPGVFLARVSATTAGVAQPIVERIRIIVFPKPPV